MAFTADVDAAIVARLASDPQLTALMPGGVGWGLAPSSTPRPTKFVVVSHVVHEDRYVMGPNIAEERLVYEIKAVVKSTSNTEVIAAGNRIQTLMQDSNLTATGYHPIIRICRIDGERYPEVDEVTDERWQHYWQQYEVFAHPL